MRFKEHTVKHAAYTRNAYGEPIATYGTASTVSMFIAWNTEQDQTSEGSRYAMYEYIGITRDHSLKVGDLVDNTLVVERIEPGRLDRVFMNLAKAKDLS